MKNKAILLFSLLLLSFSINAQTDSTWKPDKVAAFKDGINGWLRFLETNLDRDKLKNNGAPSGRYMVLASFVIDEEGRVTDIKIEKDPGYGAAEEMIRVLKKSDKKWTPAIDKGNVINFRTKQSLTFVVM